MKARYKICILPDHKKDMSFDALDWMLCHWNYERLYLGYKVHAMGQGNTLAFLLLEPPKQ